MVNEKDVRKANDGFYMALNQMFTGNTVPMENVWSHGGDVTLEGPFGGRLEGFEAVMDEFRKESRMRLAGHVEAQNVAVHTGSDLGYVLCDEVGRNMSVGGQAVVVKHRATNIFRLENGLWKMVHHHTDVNQSLEAAVLETPYVI
jgi:ketosteroid isomerase-like protein